MVAPSTVTGNIKRIIIVATEVEIYTIVNLFYENGFLRAISYRRHSLRCGALH